jgi:hypothetical protein
LHERNRHGHALLDLAAEQSIYGAAAAPAGSDCATAILRSVSLLRRRLSLDLDTQLA